MIKKLLFSGVIAALIIAYALADCTQANEPSFKAISDASDKFMHKFYKILGDEKKGNLICSPISVDIVLSMAHFGARGNTEKQIESSLNLPCDKSVTKQGYQQLIKSLNNTQGVELKLANKIFIDKGASLQSDFSEITKTYFESETQSVDFSNANKAAKTINDWSAEKTNNRITELFKPDDIEGTVMVLVNAVYFKGKWAKKFNPEYTRLSPFKVDDKTTKDVPMMYKTGKFNYGYIAHLKAQYVELPYENNDKNEAVSMFVILPDETSGGIQEVQNNLHLVNWTQLEGIEEEVALHLPKFKIESKLDLKPTLQNMGITDIFDGTADLSGIIENNKLRVSKIIQKAVIEVNEEGSEAAAATGMEFVFMSMPPEIIVNRPFLCAIVKKSVGNHVTTLFVARVTDPTN